MISGTKLRIVLHFINWYLITHGLRGFQFTLMYHRCFKFQIESQAIGADDVLR